MAATKTSRKKNAAPAPPLVRPTPVFDKPLTLEDRIALLGERMQNADKQLQVQYKQILDMSWIYHDANLEGTVYSQRELMAALTPDASGVTSEPSAIESSLEATCREIRLHQKAIEYVRTSATHQTEASVDLIREFFFILHPEEGDVKSVRYRKDMPQHRLYFHEYAPPEKISAKVKQVVDWVNNPDIVASRTPIRLAARAHYDLLRAFPFQVDSGRVARLFMNFILLRYGYPPAIVDARERRRYYDALKGSSLVMNSIVTDAILNGLDSVERMLDMYEKRSGYVVGE